MVKPHLSRQTLRITQSKLIYRFHLSLFLFHLVLDTEWVVANTELVERQNYTVRNLPTAEKINFRVVAVNIAGRSPPTGLSQPVTIREIVGEFSVDRRNRTV